MTASAESSPGVTGPRIPGSTYRLQLHPGFTFRDALDITQYLHDLGITDCYASPLSTARPGSTHGYDVCDSGKLNPGIGTPEHFEQWSKQMRRLEMGLLVDIVPNHMAADPRNSWWRDVLEKGPSSTFARWFDIDWSPGNPNLDGKVLLPILEDRYWRVLEEGKLRVCYEQDQLVLAYHEHRLPLSPSSLEFLSSKIPQSLTPRVSPEALNVLNGSSGAPASFQLLHHVLERQHYRLAFWRVGNEALNYRRFFDVTELAALRMELPEVFEASHELILSLIAGGQIMGLRVDHPDGLWNPAGYFHRLQAAIAARLKKTSASPPNPQASTRRFYVVAEKILTRDERLPTDWEVAGTTGYDFLNLLNGLFVNTANEAALDQAYRDFAGARQNFQTEVYQAKLQILHEGLLPDLQKLSRLLHEIAARTRYGVDFSGSELRDGLAEVIAAFPVYRTYSTEESSSPTPAERTFIETAIHNATAHFPQHADVFAFLQKLLLLDPPPDLGEQDREHCRRFTLKFQQLTGPVMAKGLEDTTFYRFNRFLSLNEVGGAPDQFGTSLAHFHRENSWRVEHWPHTLLATATHDTKRGEDLRARLNVLSEIPEEWNRAVMKWRELNAEKKTQVAGELAPDANDEYFLYQVLVGAWQSAAESRGDAQDLEFRICDYMQKAIREAKGHTSWTRSNLDYEQATESFVRRILSHDHTNLFLDDFMLFQRKVAFFGLFNSLAQVVLKMTVPGVPDFYQGSELWDYSLVDPDNRRPVDYEVRKRQLAELRGQFQEQKEDTSPLIRRLLRNYHTGEIKQFLIWRLLEFRRQHRQLFEFGDYTACDAEGSKADHVCAFTRAHGGEALIVVAARMVLGLTNGAQRGALESDVWQGTVLRLPPWDKPAAYRNLFTGQILTLGEPGAAPAIPELLGVLPAAVWVRLQ